MQMTPKEQEHPSGFFPEPHPQEAMEEETELNQFFTSIDIARMEKLDDSGRFNKTEAKLI